MHEVYADYEGSSGFESSEASPGLQHVTVAPGVDDDEHLRASDVGKLARRLRRRVVGAARADDRPTFARLLADHLAVPLEGLEVVEESWPSYELVNVQVGLDTWLAQGERTHVLVGLANFRHREFGLTDLLQPVPATTTVRRRATSRGPTWRAGRTARCGPPYGRASTSWKTAGPGPRCWSSPPIPRAGWGWPSCTSSRATRAWPPRPPNRSAARGRTQRVPRPGDLLRPRDVRRARRGSAVPPSSRRVGPGRDPAQRHPGRHHPSSRGCGRAPRPVAGRRSAPQARVAALRASGSRARRTPVRYLTSQLPDTTIIVLSGDSLHSSARRARSPGPCNRR